MASKKSSQPDPTAPAVIRRYRAYGEARELTPAIAAISHGSVLVEQLDDGTFRLADDQGADEWTPALEEVEPAPAASVASTDAPATPATDAADAPESG